MRVMRRERTITRSELLQDDAYAPHEKKRLLSGEMVVKGGYEVRLRPEPGREDQLRRAGALKRSDPKS
jgi:hypothetical protein